MLNPKNVSFKQVYRLIIAGLIFAFVSLAGCQGLNYIDQAFAETKTLANVTPTPAQLDPEITLTPQATATPAPENIRLVLWVPPQFNPNEDSEASRLLAEQLKSFTVQNPEVSLDVRVKAASGAGSMLDTLDFASQVAADALPDLVLLARGDLEAAALKGLLQPIEEVSSKIDESDWYGFAQSMGIVQGTAYGLPFAADALGLVYRNTALPDVQPSWAQVNAQVNQLVFPAADQTVLATLAIYLSAGGALQDPQGQAFIDVDTLTQTLQIYQTGLNSGLFSAALLELQSDDQAWETFQNSTAEGIITWASRQLQNSADLKLAQLPVLGESSFTLAKGWAWCLVAQDPVEKEYASLLMEHLVEPEFLKNWASVSGYLPVRPSSITAWENPLAQDTLASILNTAQLRPNPDQISAFNNGIRTAVQEVLSGQSQPEDSAQKAAQSLEVVE